MSTNRIIAEWEYAAEDLAKRGLLGNIGDPLPNYMSADTVQYINNHLEDFQARIRQCAYAHAMEKIAAKYEKGE